MRARSADCPTPTELLLTGSSRLGDEVCLATDRKFLERAVRLGFRELCFVADNAPLVCRDGQREYFWALLDKSGIVKSAPDAVRIESMNGQDSSVAEPAAEPKPVGGPRRRSARTLTAIEEPAGARPVQTSEPRRAAESSRSWPSKLNRRTGPPSNRRFTFATSCEQPSSKRGNSFPASGGTASVPAWRLDDRGRAFLSCKDERKTSGSAYDVKRNLCWRRTRGSCGCRTDGRLLDRVWREPVDAFGPEPPVQANSPSTIPLPAPQSLRSNCLVLPQLRSP